MPPTPGRMSLIVTSYDLKVAGGVVNCRCSRLQAEKASRHTKILTQSRKDAKLQILLCGSSLRLCAFARVIVLNTAPSFSLRHPVLLQNPVDLRPPLL